MPDLSKEAVNYFWCDYDKRTLYRIVSSMQQVEDWTVDDLMALDAAYVLLGRAMDDNRSYEFTDIDSFIKVLIHAKSARALRIMQFVDGEKPGTASNILMHAENVSQGGADASQNPYASLFLKRNLVFERLQLLSRIFAADRLSLVIRALEAQDE
ncbi:MAG: type IVB secretion system protein IcmW [Pseudomonadota bacterium]